MSHMFKGFYKFSNPAIGLTGWVVGARAALESVFMRPECRYGILRTTNKCGGSLGVPAGKMCFRKAHPPNNSIMVCFIERVMPKGESGLGWGMSSSPESHLKARGWHQIANMF